MIANQRPRWLISSLKILDILFIIGKFLLMIYGIIILLIINCNIKETITQWIILNIIQLYLSAWYRYYYLNGIPGRDGKFIGLMLLIFYCDLMLHGHDVINNKNLFQFTNKPEYTYIQINMIIFFVILISITICSFIHLILECCLGFLIICRMLNNRHPIVIFFPGLRDLYPRLDNIEQHTFPIYEFIPDIEKGKTSCDEQCAICLTPYEATEMIMRLPCNHIFHHTCISEWLKVNASCPMCRANVIM